MVGIQTGPKVFDVLQLEYHSKNQELYKNAIGNQGLGCFFVGSQGVLEEALSDKFIGKVNVVDGGFPEKKGGLVKDLYSRAVEMIRKEHPDADIILFSLNNLEDKARALGVEYWDKIDYTPKSFAEALKKRIDSKS